MERHILHRLLVAKHFLADARRVARTSSNDLSLSRVVVHLHDAVDNLLGAIATHYGVHLGPRDALMDAFTKLAKDGHLNEGRTTLDQLNAMRNAIKHQGIPQNASAVLASLKAVDDLADRFSMAAFEVRLDAISLTALIEKPETRSKLEAIAALIADEDYKHALGELGLLRFNELQGHRLGMLAVLKKYMEKVPLASQTFVFPSDDHAEMKLECLELGIDPDELTRFEWLTPTYGYRDMELKDLISKKDTSFWHVKNWTYENAIFCLNFLVSYLAAKQKSPYSASVLRRDVKLNVMRFVRSSSLTAHTGETVRTFNEGDQVLCAAWDYVDGAWQNFGEASGRVRIYNDDDTIDEGLILKAHIEMGQDVGEAFEQPAAG